MFRDFKAAALREIDYGEEAKNIEQFRKNYRKLFAEAEVVFPKHYPRFTTERVIVLEPLRGKKLSSISQGTMTARKAALKGLTAVLEQIFVHGFFHADPHGGNLFFLEDTGRIGFIDMGLVGQLTFEDKQKFLKVLIAVLKRDRDKLARALFELGEITKGSDYSKFEREIQALLDKVKAEGVDRHRVETLVSRLFAIARENGIVVPNRYVLMMRSCLMIEGVAKSLDPSISVFDIAMPIVTRSLLSTYNPLRWFLRK